jgi:hypothetical protein
VNRSTKLFMATALLACGYGVASLIGSPRVPYLSHIGEQEPGANSLQRQDLPPSAVVAEARPAASGVRLLPEVAASQNVMRPESQVLSAASTPYPITQFAPLDVALLMSTAPAAAPDPAATNYVIRLPRPNESSASTAALPSDVPPGLRARLRDAQPRPVRPADHGELLTTEPAKLPPPAAVTVASLPYIAPIEPAPRSRPAEITASYSAPANGAYSYPYTANLAPAAPPQPIVAPSVPKIHRIVDGDTLPKLAQRYLRDAGRGDEIFALNRDVLSNPELLPIGAELKVPSITATDRGG